MELLTDEDITARTRQRARMDPGRSSITCAATLADFRAAMLYVGAVAYLAEDANHHPDILIQWNRVTLTLSNALGGRPDRGRLRPGPADQPAALTPCPDRLLIVQA